MPQESEEQDDSSSDSSFSTVSSSAPLTGNGSGVGCSSIFYRIRGGRCRNKPCRQQRAVDRTCSRVQEKAFFRRNKKGRPGVGDVVSPDRFSVPVARNVFPRANAVQEPAVEEEISSPVQREKATKGNEASGSKTEKTKKSGSLSSAIADIFRCFICLGKLVDAQLCPCCSKLVCMICIKKSECPHCRAALQVSQLVSCNFISEITTEVEKIHGDIDEDAPAEKICPAHGSPLSYFCATCSTAVCSDCAILGESHQNHAFERLNVTYGRHSRKLQTEASALRSRLKDLHDMMESIDNDIESILKAKDDQATEIETALKRMRAKLEEQLKCKLLTLLAQKGTISQEVELLETILRQLDFHLSTSSKSDLIAHEPTITCIIQDIQKKINPDIRGGPVSSDFVSEVVPPFEHGELIIKNFRNYLHAKPSNHAKPSDSNDSSSTADSTNDIVYSGPISATGITWRLKVYPNGSGSSKGSHISAFLEMVKGGSEATTYEYGIEMLHRAQSHLKVVRRFCSEFEEGACWGYYQFYKIDDLERDGYLRPEEDTISLSFYVRAQTFLQQCLDLRRALSACQLERDEAVTQLVVLRRAFASSIWQQRRRKVSNLSDLEDDQGSIKHALAGAASSLLPTAGNLELPNQTSAKSVLNRLDKVLLSSIPSEAHVDDRSEAPSMQLSKVSATPESNEKCELWLKSRDNMFQMPASRSKFYRRGPKYRKSNRSFEVASLAKRIRTTPLPFSIPEGNDESNTT